MINVKKKKNDKNPSRIVKKKKEKTVRTIATLTSNDTEILNSFTREAFPSASHLGDQCQRCKGGTTRRLRTNASCWTVERTLTRWVSPPFDTSNRSKVVPFCEILLSSRQNYRIYEILETKLLAREKFPAMSHDRAFRSKKSKIGQRWSTVRSTGRVVG